MIARRLRIEGRVQGVGYRDWLVAQARRASVAGWVRNRRDGSLEAWLEGHTAAVDALTEACRTGPAWASVASIQAETMAEAGHTDFSRRPTSD